MIIKHATIHRSLLLVVAAFSFSLPSTEIFALPEDAQQDIVGNFDSNLLLMDEGRQIYYGTPDEPAEITQGTLNISGLEIIIESIDGEVKKVTVIGSPARFQQQPAIDQSIVVAEGNTIILDYDNQHLSVDENARFSQDNSLWSGCHIDYYIESRALSTPRCENGERAHVVLPPQNDQQN